METYSRSKSPDSTKDQIITIQYQRIDDRTGKPLGSLKILKSWESSEEQIIRDFLDVFQLDDQWNFIPLGCSLIQYDFFVLYYRAMQYNISIDANNFLRKHPFIDIKPILVILNKLKFKGSALHNFTGKKSSGANIFSLYENKKFDEIEQYIIEESEAFLDLFEWLFNSFPEFYFNNYIKTINKDFSNKNPEEINIGIQCPECGNPFLEKFDELRDGMGIDGMTEGQLAEYLAGTWGTYTCLKCDYTFDYEE